MGAATARGELELSSPRAGFASLSGTIRASKRVERAGSRSQARFPSKSKMSEYPPPHNSVSVIPPMNNLRNLMIGLLTFGLLAVPLAAADPLDDLHVEKDVAAHYKADYSQALDAVGDVKDIAGEAKDTVQAKASSKTNAGATATTGLGSDIVAGIKENAQAFLGWIKSLSVKPSPDAAGYVSATNAQDLVADARSLDGSIEGDALGHIEATSVMEKDIAEPPAPKLGFLGEMQAAFHGFLNFG